MFPRVQVRNRVVAEETVTRPEKIAQGCELVSAADYPSPEVIESLSELLARHWPAEAEPFQPNEQG